jgi:hypothetical protein
MMAEMTGVRGRGSTRIGANMILARMPGKGYAGADAGDAGSREGCW